MIDHTEGMVMDILKPPAISSKPPTTSSNDSASLATDPEHLRFAAERARLLFGCYRKGEANDPETYAAALAAILAEYPREVIVKVTDPRVGLARTNKFIPSVAEVSEACDKSKATFEAEAKLVARGYHWDGKQWSKP